MIVQHANKEITTLGSTISVSVPVTAGSTILAIVGTWGNYSRVVTVTDTIGTNYIPVLSGPATNPAAINSIQYGIAPSSGTVTVTGNIGANLRRYMVVMVFNPQIEIVRTQTDWFNNVPAGPYDATWPQMLGLPLMGVKASYFGVLRVLIGYPTSASGTVRHELFSETMTPYSDTPDYLSYYEISKNVAASYYAHVAAYDKTGYPGSLGPITTHTTRMRHEFGRSNVYLYRIAYKWPLVSGFTAPASVPINTNATMTNLSYVNPSSYLWNFGDGTTSTLTNPTKQWSVAGNYSISLKAYRDDESASSSRTITVTGPPPTMNPNGPTPPNIPTMGELPVDLPGYPAWFLRKYDPKKEIVPDAALLRADLRKLYIPPVPDPTDKSRVERAIRLLTTQVNSLTRSNQLNRESVERFIVRGRGTQSERAPTVNDDSTLGYGPGSIWVDVNGDRYDVYVCFSGTKGAAVWKRLLRL